MNSTSDTFIDEATVSVFAGNGGRPQLDPGRALNRKRNCLETWPTLPTTTCPPNAAGPATPYATEEPRGEAPPGPGNTPLAARRCPS